MGFRTTIILNNDTMGLLVTDPNIGRRLYDGIQESYIYGLPADISNLGVVAEQAHADITKLVILGGRGIFEIAELASCMYNQPNYEVELLKAAADKLGYRLIKKPKGKNNE